MKSPHTSVKSPQPQGALVEITSRSPHLNAPVMRDVNHAGHFSTHRAKHIRPLRTLASIIDRFKDTSIWVVNRELNITVVNEHFRLQYLKHWGVEINIGDSIRKAISATPEQRDEWRSIFTRCLKGEHVRIEVELLGRLHEIDLKPLSLKGEVDEIVCFGSDITDKRAQEREEAYRSERWKIAIEGNEYGMWDLDIRKNELYFSPSCYELLGYDPDEAMGRGVEDWTARIHPEDRQKSGKHMLDLLSGLKDSFKTEIRVRCKNGEYKWILDQGKAYGKDENGFPFNIIGLMKDISDRKEQEQLLNDQLERLTHFAFLTSHHLRLPVANILGLTDMLSEDGKAEELMRIARYLKQSALSLDEVIREMNQVLTDHQLNLGDKQ